MLNLGDWIKRRRKYQAFTLAIRSNQKALELGAGCLISETFSYLIGVIHLIGRRLIGELLRYNFSAVNVQPIIPAHYLSFYTQNDIVRYPDLKIPNNCSY